PAQLVLADVRDLHGKQFKDADLIVASPPCQKYSYMAMPWTRAKDMQKWYRDPEHPERIVELNELFNACFRIQREACEASGRTIPLVVENVRGAQPWVGRSRWNHGSYHLWGDLPALMPIVVKAQNRGLMATKNNGGSWFNVAHNTTSGKGQNPVNAIGMNWSDRTRKGQDFTAIAGRQAMEANGIKCGGDWFDGNTKSQMRQHSSKSPKRKLASALIAKIPFDLSRHIARVYYPQIPSLAEAAT
ncbi:MAG TPA: hypothetical protein VFB99_09835, partial [Vicinamibacterales bacterium]|nr:hypothetical protein [Vicinamibacterales bacterium]